MRYIPSSEFSHHSFVMAMPIFLTIILPLGLLCGFEPVHSHPKYLSYLLAFSIAWYFAVIYRVRWVMITNVIFWGLGWVSFCVIVITQLLSQFSTLVSSEQAYSPFLYGILWWMAYWLGKIYFRAFMGIFFFRTLWLLRQMTLAEQAMLRQE